MQQIIPIGGAVLVNGEPQKAAAEVMPEIAISVALSDLAAVRDTPGLFCVQIAINNNLPFIFHRKIVFIIKMMADFNDNQQFFWKYDAEIELLLL